MYFIVFNGNATDSAGFESYEEAVEEAKQWLADGDSCDQVTLYEAEPIAKIFYPEPVAVVAPL